MPSLGGLRNLQGVEEREVVRKMHQRFCGADLPADFPDLIRIMVIRKGNFTICLLTKRPGTGPARTFDKSQKTETIGDPLGGVFFGIGVCKCAMRYDQYSERQGLLRALGRAYRNYLGEDGATYPKPLP